MYVVCWGKVVHRIKCWLTRIQAQTGRSQRKKSLLIDPEFESELTKTGQCIIKT